MKVQAKKLAKTGPKIFKIQKIQNKKDYNKNKIFTCLFFGF